jgi:hypothetical protein
MAGMLRRIETMILLYILLAILIFGLMLIGLQRGIRDIGKGISRIVDKF